MSSARGARACSGGLASAARTTLGPRVLHAIFDMGISVGEKLLRALLVYGFLLTALRLLGKRELAQQDTLDFLVLLAPYSEENRHLIDARVFSAMKPSGYLINLARGGIVDEIALIVALERGQLAGAALDVFQEEPLPTGHPLWSTRNVVITPHLGGFCDVYAERALPAVEHNMACFLRGEFDKMINVVRR